MNSQTAILKVLQHEGGFVNDPDDPGGATNFGITKKVYEEFKGRIVSVDEIRSMPKSDAIAIYKREYWDKIGGDLIKSYGVAFALFDQAVNRGVDAAVKQAQRIVGSYPDGKIGPLTVNAINAHSENDFLSKYLAASIAAYKDIAARRPASLKFLDGWLKRVDSISDYVGVKPAILGVGSLFLMLSIFFLIYFLGFSKK